MANFMQDNTLIVQDSGLTGMTSWMRGSQVNQIRIVALNTNANVVFHINAGTPIFEWRYQVHGAVSVGSCAAVLPAMYSYPFHGQAFPTAWIPTLLTAATAWIDFR